MESGKTVILENPSIQSKLDRIAWEIYESNASATELIMVGIDRRGRLVAEALAEKLSNISEIKIIPFVSSGGKNGSNASLNAPADALSDRDVIIVDDVLYSGKTMFKTLAATMELGPSRIQVAVLIDRGHRSIPVSPDFVGLELGTTLKQYVSVEVEETTGEMKAFLF